MGERLKRWEGEKTTQQRLYDAVWDYGKAIVAASAFWLIAVTSGLVRNNPSITVVALGILLGVSMLLVAWATIQASDAESMVPPFVVWAVGFVLLLIFLTAGLLPDLRIPVASLTFSLIILLLLGAAVWFATRSVRQPRSNGRRSK